MIAGFRPSCAGPRSATSTWFSSTPTPPAASVPGWPTGAASTPERARILTACVKDLDTVLAVFTDGEEWHYLQQLRILATAVLARTGEQRLVAARSAHVILARCAPPSSASVWRCRHGLRVSVPHPAPRRVDQYLDEPGESCRTDRVMRDSGDPDHRGGVVENDVLPGQDEVAADLAHPRQPGECQASLRRRPCVVPSRRRSLVPR